jgi:hypothetical protein
MKKVFPTGLRLFNSEPRLPTVQVARLLGLARPVAEEWRERWWREGLSCDVVCVSDKVGETSLMLLLLERKRRVGSSAEAATELEA